MTQTTTALTCRELTDFLADYLDGTLRPGERILFEQHLAACPECVSYLQSYRDTIALTRRACGPSADPVPPPEVPDELVRAILAARRGEGRR